MPNVLKYVHKTVCVTCCCFLFLSTTTISRSKCLASSYTTERNVLLNHWLSLLTTNTELLWTHTHTHAHHACIHTHYGPLPSMSLLFMGGVSPQTGGLFRPDTEASVVAAENMHTYLYTGHTHGYNEYPAHVWFLSWINCSSLPDAVMTVSCWGRAAGPEVDPHGAGGGGAAVERREDMCEGLCIKQATRDQGVFYGAKLNHVSVHTWPCHEWKKPEQFSRIVCLYCDCACVSGCEVAMETAVTEKTITVHVTGLPLYESSSLRNTSLNPQ